MAGTDNRAKNTWRKGKGGWVQAHVAEVERVLGKALSKGVQVHHVDGNPANNDHSNLVVCPNQAYHALLHQRQRAYDACGHAHYLRCSLCAFYDNPENFNFNKSLKWHKPGKCFKDWKF